MVEKKQVLAFVSISITCFLVGSIFNVMATDSGGNPWDNVWEAIYDLQARVTSLEESTNTKTWNFVTNFTLSEEHPTSPLFFIQGEKWRIRWKPLEEPSGPYGFIIWDENGYLIDHPAIIGIPVTDPKGIYYVPHGEGNYYIEDDPGISPDLSCTIESYH